MSRLALGLLAATFVHGLLYAAGVAFFPGPPTREDPPTTVDVEVDVVAAKPDPVAANVEAPTPRPARQARTRALTAPVPAATAVDEGPPEAPTVVDVPAPPPSPPRPKPATSGEPTARAFDGGGALLSAKPRYRVNPAPEYPIASSRRREEGVVMVKVMVDANGAPSAISLATSSGHPLLDAAALDAVRRWTFDPARAAGVPVSSLVTVPVRFSLSDAP